MMKEPVYGLIVIAAPSGTGKSTLCKRLLLDHSDSIQLSISTTSRAPRGQEKHTVEYFFVDESEFKQKVTQGEFAEWALVHGNHYGTEKKILEMLWARKKHVLLDIDVQGAASLKAAFPDRIFSIFLTPPSLEELERRLRTRATETEEAIQRRMNNARSELAQKDKFDLVLVNGDLEETYSELEKVVMKFAKELETGQWQKLR